MSIHEYQAKRLLQSCGLTIPKGELARTPDEARENAIRLKGDAWMVKAQIRAGHRGVGLMPDGLGGIRRADTIDQVSEITSNMLGKSLITEQTSPAGLLVKTVYIEQFKKVDKELGISLMVDDRAKAVVMLLSSQGGRNYLASAEGPESVPVHRQVLHPSTEIGKEQLYSMLEETGIDSEAVDSLHADVGRLIKLFFSKDATLIELNPLGLSGGKWIALDAKMSFDRNALFRQEEIYAFDREDPQSVVSRQASLDGFNYLELDGNVASISVGAGLSMATLDAITHYGGKPANFLDLPPDSKVNRVLGALELVLTNPKTKSVLINVFGGGIMRCDTISDALTLRHNSRNIAIPLVVRLAGTNARLANRRLRESMPMVYLADNLAEAAQFAVKAESSNKKGAAAVSPLSLMSKLKSVLGY